MRKYKRGFTLVEVSLFLAISGLLLVGVIVGTQNSISAQRFKDSVQNYVEFLRSVYSEVSNPQSPGSGRSDYAIYGKLVTFGQTTASNGTAIPDYEQRIYVYDVIGQSDSIGTGAVTAALVAANANVIVENKDASGNVTSVSLAGNVREYVPTWGAAIDTTKNGELYKGSILIVRHPRSGTISTLVYSGNDGVIQVNKLVKDANSSKNFANVRNMLKNKLKVANGFKSDEVNFCVNPKGIGAMADVRRNIRLLANARNVSGVELINQDDANNECLK